MTKKYIVAVFPVLLSLSYLSGQNLDKIVYVESTYRPTLIDAEKTSQMPVYTDSIYKRPEINYSVLPSHIEPNYQLKPIKPAKLVGSPLDELYKSCVKLGLGNYTTPLAEFSIHNLRSKEYAVGAYIFHKSSHGKLELENGNKVPAGYGKNRISAYGKRFYDQVNVEGEVYLNTDKIRFYGYNTNLVDTSLKVDDINQFYTKIGARAGIYSTSADSGAFGYHFGIDANHFSDAFDNRENHLKIPVEIGFNVESFRVSLTADYNLFNSTLGDSSSDKSVFSFSPLLRKSTKDWEVLLGGNITYVNEEESNTYFFPEAKLSFKVVDKVLDVYFGISGRMEINSLSKLAEENPYIMPGLNVDDTRYKIIGYGGLKGQLGKDAGYRLDLSYNSIENARLYVNDTFTVLQNQFFIESENMDIVRFQGELWYSPVSYLDFYFRGQYNSFTLSQEIEPWHIPRFNLKFGTSYNFKEKVYARFNLIQQGKRYAKDWSNPDLPIELDPIWDLNIGIEYKYSNVLSIFADFNNLLSKSYYLWNQYPTQKLNVLAGFSYKF